MRLKTSGLMSAKPQKKIIFACSNSNQAKTLLPVSAELRARGYPPSFLAFDNFYHQGAKTFLEFLLQIGFPGSAS